MQGATIHTSQGLLLDILPRKIFTPAILQASFQSPQQQQNGTGNGIGTGRTSVISPPLEQPAGKPYQNGAADRDGRAAVLEPSLDTAEERESVRSVL